MSSLLFMEKIDWFWRAALIHLFIVLLFIFSFIDMALPLKFDIKPYFILITIFYWAINRPSILSSLFLFFLGVVQDIFFEYPIGFHSILYLTFFYFIRKQRLYLQSQTYIVSWMFFGLICLLFSLFEWIFFSLRFANFFDISILLVSSIFTILIYPIINAVFIALNKLLSSVSNVENF